MSLSVQLGLLLALATALASIVGFLYKFRGAQAAPVIAVTSAAANVCTIAAGSAVFGEPLPGDTVALAARVLAFALVIGAAALTPPPIRAADPPPA